MARGLSIGAAQSTVPAGSQCSSRLDSVPTEISTGRFDEYAPTVSPDGRWLAYVSVESGREEVYVRPFPDITRARWQVSPSGGYSPVWSRDGRELFFAAASGHLAAIDIAPGPEFRASPVRNLFALGTYLLAPYHQSFHSRARRPDVPLCRAGGPVVERGIRHGPAELGRMTGQRAGHRRGSFLTTRLPPRHTGAADDRMTRKGGARWPIA